MTRPAIHFDLIEHIFTFIPAENKMDLCRLSLSSRAFREVAQRMLHRVPILNSSDFKAFPLLTKTLQASSNLGRTVRALRLCKVKGSKSDSTHLFGMMTACQGLEELSLRSMKLWKLAELIAIPKSLRLLHLDDCSILGSASTSSCNSIKYLAISDTSFACIALPPRLFPNLVTLSMTEPVEAGFSKSTLVFLLKLPGSLRCLRLHFQDLWYGRYFDEGVSSWTPSIGDWESAFSRLTLLEQFEVDILCALEGQSTDKEAFKHALLLKFINSGANFQTLKISPLRADWEATLKGWVQDLTQAPRCFSTVKRIVITDWSEVPHVLELEYWCRKAGIELVVEERSQERAESGQGLDPFWSEFIDERRWLHTFERDEEEEEENVW